MDKETEIFPHQEKGELCEPFCIVLNHTPGTHTPNITSHMRLGVDLCGPLSSLYPTLPYPPSHRTHTQTSTYTYHFPMITNTAKHPNSQINSSLLVFYTASSHRTHTHSHSKVAEKSSNVLPPLVVTLDDILHLVRETKRNIHSIHS